MRYRAPVSGPDAETAIEGAIPQSTRVEEKSIPNPPAPTGPILTIPADEISQFFVRVRREPDLHTWDIRLDAALREILERANDFVPSESGGILLDDPRAKRAGAPAPRLTFIAAYGPDSAERLGRRLPSDRGIVGDIYRVGQAVRAEHLAKDDPLNVFWSGGAARVNSIIGVPVIVGESICGVLQLVNRRSGTPYSARDGELLRIFAGYMSSSIQIALDAIRARALSRLDHLTGLYNSRFFHARLQEEIERSDRDGSDLSLLFLDLDKFKAINDRYGHLAGSWSLREVARALAAEVPPASVLARYGGDEFAALLPGTSIGQAMQAAEALRLAVDALELFDTESTPDKPAQALPRVTCSIGVASYREHLAPGGSKRHRENVLLRLADEAMYRAKSAGRNQVLCADAED